MTETPAETDPGLVVVGGSRGAVSLAIEAKESGMSDVVLLAEDSIAVPDVRSLYGIDLRVTTLTSIGADDGGVTVTTSDGTLEAKAVARLGLQEVPTSWPLSFPDEVRERVHLGTPDVETWDIDLLVVGGSERAAEMALSATAEGSQVVLCRMGVPSDHLSRLLRGELLRREAERRLTVLWHSIPVDIDVIGGDPIVGFEDVGTPDLVFDHVVFADPTELGVEAGAGDGPIWTLGDGPGDLPPGRAWATIRRSAFDHLVDPAAVHTSASSIEELRETHYNATITHFTRTHSDLWVIRVEPDHGDVSHEAGQYGSLGLGYWEERADGARDPGLDSKWEKLVRRSYSISSPVFDENGYLHDPTSSDMLEFYVVLVPPSGDRVPGLTPRLALRRLGDRIYVGPRVAGRYTLTPVTDPEATVLLLSTGTGEAPHNAMVTELLSKGHTGPIVSVVSVRYQEDLGYLDTHRRLERRFPSYHYLPLVTRHPSREKLYVQDVIRRDLIESEFGVALDPERTHVYLCGNPAMIGSPEWADDRPVFPEPEGACELLAERGFDLDRRGHIGNVHTEKYW